MKGKIIVAFAALFSAMLMAFAPTSNWQITAKYNIRFSGSGDVGGIFKKMSGTISFDEAKLSASAINVAIEANSMNTGNALMNTHAKSSEWFDVAKYPLIKFSSNAITGDKTGYLVKGTLEMHGTAKEITIPFKFQNNGSTGLFSGTFNVNRSDFHLGEPGGDVEEKIKIELSVPVQKK